MKFLFFVVLGICPLIFLPNLTRNPYFIKKVIIEIGIAVCLGMGLIKIVKEQKIPRTFLDFPLWTFVLVCLVSFGCSLLIHPEMRSAILAAGGWAMVFLLFNCVFVFYIGSLLVRERKSIFVVVFIVTALASLYAILQHQGIEPFLKYKDIFTERGLSTFGNPLFLASWLVLVIPVMLVGFLQEENYRRKGLLFVLLLLSGYALLITRCRSAWLGIFVALTGLLISLPKELVLRNTRWIGTVIIAGIIAVSIPIKGKSPVRTFINSVRGSFDLQQQAYQQRNLMWKSTFSMFKEHPLLGQGWGNFRLFYPFHQAKYLRGGQASPSLRTHAFNAHNIILQILASVGIVGLTAGFWLLVTFYRRTIKFCRQQVNADDKLLVLAFSWATVGVLIDNLLNVSLWYPVPALLCFTWLGMAAGIIQPEEFRRLRKSKIYSFALLAGVFGFVVVYFNLLSFSSEVYYFKGFKYLKKYHQPEKAIVEFKKSHRLYSLNSEVTFLLGNIYARSGRLDEAIWAYNESNRADPSYDETWFNLAQAYAGAGEWEKAIGCWEHVLRINPDRKLKRGQATFLRPR